MNLSKEELIEIVRAFRSSNTNIVNLWRSVEKAFIEAVKNKSVVHLDNNISFIYDKNILFIKVNTHIYMYPTRLLSPWISPGKNSGVGYHALLQEIFLTWGSNLDFLHGQADSLPSEPPRKPKNISVY